MNDIKKWSLQMLDAHEMILLNRDSTHSIPDGPPENEHSHDFFEIEYIISGSGTQIINGREYPVRKGDVILLKIGDTHSYSSKDSLRIVNCIFDPIAFSDEVDILTSSIKSNEVIPNYLSLSGDDVLDVEYIIVKMEEEYEKKEVDYVNALRNYLQLFIIKLMRSVKKQLSNNLNYQIRRAIEFIEANFSTIHPSDVSSFLSYNSSYFSKIFKEQTGVNISEYINRKRIKEAFRMIKDSNSTIEAISLAVGFKDKKHFNQMFKRYVGTTPNTIRKNK